MSPKIEELIKNLNSERKLNGQIKQPTFIIVRKSVNMAQNVVSSEFRKKLYFGIFCWVENLHITKYRVQGCLFVVEFRKNDNIQTQGYRDFWVGFFIN